MKSSLVRTGVPRPWKRLERHELGRGVLVYQRLAESGTHLTVTLGVDGPLGLHMTVTHRHNMIDPFGMPIAGRYPTVAEMREAIVNFIPDGIGMALVFPEERQWANAHPSTVHLYQVERPVRLSGVPKPEPGQDVVASEQPRTPPRPQSGPLVLVGSRGGG